MSLSCPQLRDIIVQPALSAIGLCSDAAINLILGTAAQETQLGRYVVQVGIEPYSGGIGIYQMQAPTYDFIWQKHVEPSTSMKAKIKLYLGFEGKPLASRMASDLALATVMARLLYANVLETLPQATDVKGLGRYWKIYWNTMKGAGTVDQFVENYKEYVV